jgi:hypothetical protein
MMRRRDSRTATSSTAHIAVFRYLSDMVLLDTDSLQVDRFSLLPVEETASVLDQLVQEGKSGARRNTVAPLDKVGFVGYSLENVYPTNVFQTIT